MSNLVRIHMPRTEALYSGIKTDTRCRCCRRLITIAADCASMKKFSKTDPPLACLCPDCVAKALGKMTTILWGDVQRSYSRRFPGHRERESAHAAKVKIHYKNNPDSPDARDYHRAEGRREAI